MVSNAPLRTRAQRQNPAAAQGGAVVKPEGFEQMGGFDCVRHGGLLGLSRDQGRRRHCLAC